MVAIIHFLLQKQNLRTCFSRPSIWERKIFLKVPKCVAVEAIWMSPIFRFAVAKNVPSENWFFTVKKLSKNCTVTKVKKKKCTVGATVKLVYRGSRKNVPCQKCNPINIKLLLMLHTTTDKAQMTKVMTNMTRTQTLIQLLLVNTRMYRVQLIGRTES